MNRKREMTLVIIIILSILFTGCQHKDKNWTVHPVSFDSPPDMIADGNTTDIQLALNHSMLVSYSWSPEEGRYWRISVTEGLFVSGDRFISYPDDIPVAETGVRQWMVRAIAPGNHTFYANIRPQGNAWKQDFEKKVINVSVII